MLRPMKWSTSRAVATSCLVVLVVLGGVGCVSAEDRFIQGRKEILCLAEFPVCATVAGCEITREDYVVTAFPGNQQFLFRTAEADAIVTVQIFFRDRTFPGTQVLVRLHTPDCGNYDEASTFSDDTFQEAGDDRTLEFELDAGGEGAHLLEVFSDATATALIRSEFTGTRR
jgi:hypothetical protein